MRDSLALRDIVGQPPVRHLQAFVDSVRRGEATSKAFLLEGPPGIGKTESAMATAAALGCHDDFGGGLFVVDCSRLGVDKCDELFRCSLRLRPCTETGWKCLILEEFECISKPCQINLKFHLDEKRIPARLCVIATSNVVNGIDKAVLSRMKPMPYSNGEAFAKACQDRLKHLWAMRNPGQGMPIGWTGWGKSFNETGYDMRSALQCLDEALAERELVCA